jgi:hypothetical protein
LCMVTSKVQWFAWPSYVYLNIPVTYSWVQSGQ